MFGVVGILALPSVWAGGRDEWRITMLMGDTIEAGAIDSVDSHSIYIGTGEQNHTISFDSIGAIAHRSPVSLSIRSYTIGLGAAIVGVAIFLNNAPEQSDVTIWSGAVYGLEFGGAMMLGAATGTGVGYLIDCVESHTETLDLRTEPRERKSAIVREMMLNRCE
jgi:hypothetical protein